MSFIGVDIGTSSVRSYLVSNGSEFTSTRNIERETHIKHASYITQSAQEIFNAVKETIKSTIAQAGVTHIDGIAFTATCSMVVYEVVNGDYKPYPCDYERSSLDQNVILWMDSRSLVQLKFLNETMETTELSKVGGSYIPEMGLPKLKWLSDNTPDKVELVAFELHDWITWMFTKTGTFDREGLQEKYGGLSYGAFDGSFKGIDPKYRELVGVSGIQIGSSEGLDKVFPVGTPIGTVDNQLSLELGLATNDTIVGVGCIDCYAGWLSTTSSLVPSPLYMIAGTSTCFLFPVKLNKSNSAGIKGVWGPYDLMAETQLYESGQPATGKLYESLFKEYECVIKRECVDSDIFTWLEQQTELLATEYGTLIHSLIKNYFYYGDQFGNRCPFNDPDMSTMIIDGPPYDGLPSVLDRNAKTSLVMRYNLILEFLCFQTLDLVENFALSHIIESIVVSGSQSRNDRFLRLLKTVTGKRVFVCDQKDSCGVARGAAQIAAAACFKHEEKNARLKEILFEGDTTADRSVLLRKQKLNKEMAAFQTKFRNIMACM